MIENALKAPTTIGITPEIILNAATAPKIPAIKGPHLSRNSETSSISFLKSISKIVSFKSLKACFISANN